MVSESVYVTVAIACVVTLLIVTVIVIYCIKRQQDKEQWRQRQEERARIERQRRQIRGNVVRPPPYYPHRGDITQLHHAVPFTPPPAYKETASPLPPHLPPSTQVVGIAGPAYPPPNYEQISSVEQSIPCSITIPYQTQNIPPTTTVSRPRQGHQPRTTYVNSIRHNNTINNINRNGETTSASEQDLSNNHQTSSTGETLTSTHLSNNQRNRTDHRKHRVLRTDQNANYFATTSRHGVDISTNVHQRPNVEVVPITSQSTSHSLDMTTSVIQSQTSTNITNIEDLSLI